MNESENREAQLFEKCLDLPAGEREAFLEKECPDNLKLRERVLHLLSMYETSDDFLETEPGDGSAGVMNELQRIAPSDEASGDRIGRYRLLEVIGEGAWGSVWLAEQVEDVERRVALKILKLGLDTKEFLARFEAERQMLAMMDHPNIARILDAGATKLGRPYFVMELVKGVPLVEYADRERLTIRERVELFSQVCLGVQHAHGKGIIHRDLKPSNILVAVHDDKPVVKIIDFGIAKTTQFRLANKTLFTSYNSFLGTPVYSSPEQLSGGQEVDHRSDIYSLGALLYELLCGRTLFDAADPEQVGFEGIKKMILEDEPSLASTRFTNLPEIEKSGVSSSRSESTSKITSQLKGDLDWIVAKCVEKERPRRYDSVRELNQDLQRYLSNETVSAASPSVSYRVSKFLRREKSGKGVWVLGTVAAMLLLFFIIQLISPKQDSLVTATTVVEDETSSIAVLPLLNMSSVSENAFFAAGIHEDIMTNLSRIDGLRVLSRTTAMKFVGSDMSLSEIGNALDARYLVEGSVRRIDNHVRVTVQLIDSVADSHLWANNYDRELVDVFATQSAIAKDIANAIHLEIRPETVGRLNDMPTHSVKAYDLFMQAKSRDRSEPESEASLTAMRELLEEAVKIDPGYVDAWGFLNETYDHMRRNIRISDWFSDEPAVQAKLLEDLTAKATDALNKAIALDPDNIETLLARASDWVAENDPETGVQFMADRKVVIDRAIELYPEDAIAWYVLAWWYRLDNQMGKASETFKKALDLDPLNARIITGALVHFDAVIDTEMIALLVDRLDKSLGRAKTGQKLNLIRDTFFETADESLIDSMWKEVNDPNATFENGLERMYWTLVCLSLRGDYDSILEVETPTILGEPSDYMDYYLYCHVVDIKMSIHLFRGEQDRARELAKEMLETVSIFEPGDHWFVDSAMAKSYATLGQPDKAVMLAEGLIGKHEEVYDPFAAEGIIQLANVDADRAVKLLQSMKPPNAVYKYKGTDVIILNHIEARALMVHPVFQTLYVNEGKWVNLLAKLIPEYEKYLEE